MKYIKNDELKNAEHWMSKAAKVAKDSLCLRDKCGSVIVKDSEIIGKGYNSPPLDNLEFRTCLNKYSFTEKKKFDRTCCMHAEWRAILDAVKNNSAKIIGSQLYFMRLDQSGVMTRAGKPYCTVCSRFALDTGIAEFFLWHKDGIAVYSTDEFNSISYEFLMK